MLHVKIASFKPLALQFQLEPCALDTRTVDGPKCKGLSIRDRTSIYVYKTYYNSDNPI